MNNDLLLKYFQDQGVKLNQKQLLRILKENILIEAIQKTATNYNNIQSNVATHYNTLFNTISVSSITIIGATFVLLQTKLLTNSIHLMGWSWLCLCIVYIICLLRNYCFNKKCQKESAYYLNKAYYNRDEFLLENRQEDLEIKDQQNLVKEESDKQIQELDKDKQELNLKKKKLKKDKEFYENLYLKTTGLNTFIVVLDIICGISFLIGFFLLGLCVYHNLVNTTV